MSQEIQILLDSIGLIHKRKLALELVGIDPIYMDNMNN